MKGNSKMARSTDLGSESHFAEKSTKESSEMANLKAPARCNFLTAENMSAILKMGKCLARVIRNGWTGSSFLDTGNKARRTGR